MFFLQKGIKKAVYFLHFCMIISIKNNFHLFYNIPDPVAKWDCLIF